MELRQLEFVVAVAEHLNFGRAAESLHVGQPAVSQQVARLERELGCSLFERTSRSVALTSEGERFVAAARGVLAAVDRARDSVGPRDRHRLRIGTSSGLGLHLGRIVSTLAVTAPGVTVELYGAATRARVEQVRAGQLDAAFVRGARLPGDLECVPVWDDPLVAALPVTHALAQADPVPLVGLRTLPLRLVTRAVNQPLVDLVLDACTAAGFEPERESTAGRIEDTLMMVAAARPSWAVLYAAHAAALSIPGVVFRPFDPPLAMPTACVTSPLASSALLAPLLAACIDHDR